MFESGGEFGRYLQGCIVGSFRFGRRHVADGLKKPAAVESVDPFKRCELDGLKRPPWSLAPDLCNAR